MIIHREANSSGHLTDEIIDYNFRMNGDGFGIAWREGGKLNWEKFDPKEKAEFRSLLTTIDSDETVEYVAHFRKATHGSSCSRLAHPFSYEDPEEGTVLVFHNGIVDIKISGDESDTSTFVTQVLANLKSRWWEEPHIKFLVESAIGWSRLAIMTLAEVVHLDGGTSWMKEDNIWYSTTPGPWKGTGTYKGTANSSYRKPDSKTSADDDDDEKYGSWSERADFAGIYVRGKYYTWAEHTAMLDAQEREGKTTTVEVINTQESKTTHLLPAGTATTLSRVVEKPPKALTTDRGHEIIGIGEVVRDANDDDEAGWAQCTVCSTIGEYYMIDGHMTVDIQHDTPLDDEYLLPEDVNAFVGALNYPNLAFAMEAHD